MDEGYCIYLRKSREDKELEKYDGIDTLMRHRNALIELAQKQNLIISKVYEEVVSADTIEDRPKMKELLSDVEDGKWKGVLVMEVERLARGETTDQGIVAEAFKYSSTKIITPSKTYDPNNEFDEEYFEFGLFMSRREYKTTNRRLQRGRLASVKEGKYVGSKAPYGYIRKKLDNDKGFTLEENPEEATVIKMIFNLYAYEDYSIGSIREKLNTLGYKPREKDKWSESTLRDILGNPVYIGKTKWNSRKVVTKMKNGKKVNSRPRNLDMELYDGIHKAIIDEATWNIVAEKRKKHKPPVAHNNIVKNPLAGIVYCGKCGNKMQRRPYNLKNKPPTLICTNPYCDNISSKIDIVETRIIEGINDWLKNLEIDTSKKKNKPDNDIQLFEQYNKNIANLKSKLNKIQELLEDGIYSQNNYIERSKIIKEDIKKAEIERNKIAVLLEQKRKVQDRKEQITPKLQNILDSYNGLTTAEAKNNLLRTVIEKVEYKKETKAIKKDSNPSEFELHIYPKIPRV